MYLKQLFVAVPLPGSGTVNAGQTINEAGAIVCVNDKWDEKEVEKGHKLVDYAGRCVNIPNDPSTEKVTEKCVEMRSALAAIQRVP